jgi:hypothetical protein
MKYLITESKLDSLIFRYLDNQDFIQINYTYETYFVNSRGDKSGVIKYDSQDDRCYIDFNLIDEVSSFFSLKETYSKNIIKEWVGNKLNVEIKDVAGIGEFFSEYLRMR